MHSIVSFPGHQKRMKTLAPCSLSGGLLLLGVVAPGRGQENSTVLPPGVRAVWEASKASRETTSTREKLCINGLWRWQPGRAEANQVPSGDWGFFKVSGCWPGITDYEQKDCQTVFTHPRWKAEPLGNLTVAWYQREISVPKEWAGRRMALSVEYLNSLAAVFVDGTNRGEIRFPGGELDLTTVLRPGAAHVLSLRVVALALTEVLLSYHDTNTGRETRSQVARRGLCGDVFLISTPSGPRLADIKVDTSVRKWEIKFEAAIEGLVAGRQYAIAARVTKDGRLVKEFTSKPFTGSTLQAGRFAFTNAWKPDGLWDLNAPQNQYAVTLALRETGG